MYADIIVKTTVPSIGKSFTYKVPEDLISLTHIGATVEVPFGRKNAQGVIQRIHSNVPSFVSKPIIKITPGLPLLSEREIAIALFISIFYSTNYFDALALFTPSKQNKENLVTIPEVFYTTPTFKRSIPILTKDQLEAINTIWNKRLDKKPFLLHGITGSGKTEVYLQIAERLLIEGKQVVFLVPEISLTPQLTQRFIDRFGQEQVALVHSQITPTKRSKTWTAIRTGQKNIIIGSRSAILYPMQRLGGIIIDECHEQSYKQDTTPRYNAIDVARYIARKESILLILGSATPSLEIYHEAKQGKMELVLLPNKITQVKSIHKIVDLKESNARKYPLLSNILLEQIRETLERKDQIMIYLNRRGLNSSLICSKCGYTETCIRCSMPLTLHSKNNRMRLVCHHCFYTKDAIQTCPECRSPFLKGVGTGTQALMQILQAEFPQARLMTMDRDSLSAEETHMVLFERFLHKEADILIGTQMITKGWDIHSIGLTAYILVESDLVFPSYRTSERVYQTIVQLSGRSGRGALEGINIIQTYNTENPLIQEALQGSFEDFYQSEVQARLTLGYPPASNLIQIISRNENEALALAQLTEYDKELQSALKTLHPTLTFEKLGPSRCFISKRNNQFFFQILYKLKKDSTYVESFTAETNDLVLIYQYIHEINPKLLSFIQEINRIGKKESIFINIEPFDLQ